MELHLTLDPATGPLRRGLERALREAIRSGWLPGRTRLPPTRALAADLGVSRGVVVEAYAQLSAEGYLWTTRGAGTHVADVAPRSATVDAARTPAGRAPARFDLDPSLPAVDGFPRAAWLAAFGRVLGAVPDAALGYGDPLGEPALREALAAWLRRRRGVQTGASRLVVTGGVRRGLPCAWSLLAAAGVRRVGVEAPGWPRMAQTATRAGLEVVELPVDVDGLDPAAVEASGVGAVALTPAHQYPTGAVLSAERRGALVAWTREHDGWLVEDDFDAEYRYDRAPVGSLQGLAPDRVLQLGSMSKLLVPALRLGWLVVPEALAASLGAERPDDEPAWVDPGAPPALDQLACADLLERGELDRHLRRQRRRYARRREALLSALTDRLPEVAVEGAAAGLFVVLRFPGGFPAGEIAERARDCGLRLEVAGPSTLAVGYAALPEAAAPAAVELIEASYGSRTTRITTPPASRQTIRGG